MTLEEALFALIMTSANNVALTIANNLGSFILKKKVNRYFSCFDLPHENREANIAVFVGLMGKLAREMQLADSSFSNPHGMTGNSASALDVAKLAS
jgi:D-alanyl-D-alanine carboxypeptidase